MNNGFKMKYNTVKLYNKMFMKQKKNIICNVWTIIFITFNYFVPDVKKGKQMDFWIKLTHSGQVSYSIKQQMFEGN